MYQAQAIATNSTASQVLLLGSLTGRIRFEVRKGKNCKYRYIFRGANVEFDLLLTMSI